MANYFLVKHKVRDFLAWKSEFDAHAPMQAAAGLSVKKLLHGADDPNEVVILFKAEDVARAKAFAESANLKEVMEKAGVISKPDISFLTDAT
jgi:hypothetical protein